MHNSIVTGAIENLAIGDLAEVDLGKRIVGSVGEAIGSAAADCTERRRRTSLSLLVSLLAGFERPLAA